MKITPFDVAQLLFYLDGSPLEMPREKMRHLVPIYDAPDNEMLLMFGRQTHKSTTVGFKLVTPGLMIPSYRSLYVAPTMQQVSVFSTDKLDGTLRESPIIKQMFLSNKIASQVFYKELRNGSKIYLRSAYRNADSIRGISADQVFFDEVQDIMRDNIPVIQQCMGHSMEHGEALRRKFPNIPVSLFRRTLYAGTPKTMENTLTGLWNKSSQNEFVVKCEYCNKHNYIDEQNIGATGAICRVCGKPIWYHNGQWVATKFDMPINGFRLPQIILPWINNPKRPDAWKVNVINTQMLYSVEKYYNEILALPYANARHPINEEHIVSCCVPDLTCAREDTGLASIGIKPGAVTCVAGIDWGKGDTASGTSYSVISIGAFINGKFTTIFMKRYTGRQNSEALYQLQDMITLIKRFNCKLVIADTGDGRTSNAHLVKALGPQRFTEIYENGVQKTLIKWSTDGKYVISRTQMMTNLFMEIQRQQVRFFRFDEFKNFMPDFTGIYTEYSDRTRLTMYDHNIPDDAFHAYMYSRIASGILRGEFDRMLGGGEQSNEPEIDFGNYNVNEGFL